MFKNIRGAGKQRSFGSGGRSHSGGSSSSDRGAGGEGRVRGKPSQALERYMSLAQDATSFGDWIAAEGFYQHAEHYRRILGGGAYQHADRVVDAGPVEAEPPSTHEKSADHEGSAEGKPHSSWRTRRRSKPRSSVTAPDSASSDTVTGAQKSGSGVGQDEGNGE